jgi:NADH:ubiquinone oxidoreductase subunit C
VEKETLILEKLGEKFESLKSTGRVARDRRIYIEVPGDIFMSVLDYAAHELSFDHLCTITGLDFVDGYEFLYHVSCDEGIVLSLKLKIPKEDPKISSVLPIYNGATFYEKELEGLLGVKVEGLPEGRQYPLPDNWPKGEYPLRKDWNPEVLKNI